MRRALLVSYYFPPRFSIGGKRAHRFAKYLPEHGWRTVVLTARAPHGERVDPSFSDAELPACAVRREYLSASELARVAGRKMGSDGTLEAPTETWGPQAPRRGLARLAFELRLAPIVGPDTSIVPALSVRIARLARSASVDVVAVTGPPWEAVVAAAIAAKLARLPLVLDLRDPWSFGPLAERHPTWSRKATSAVERAALRSATAIVVTTEATREAYSAIARGARVECIRNGFDQSVRVEPRRTEQATFVHFGNCYGARTLAPFLRALAEIVHRRALLPRDVRLLNLGRVARTDVELADRLGIGAHFEHQTVLPYAEGIGLVAGADLALLPGFGNQPWFIPGKLYDYLLAGTPILAASATRDVQEILATTQTGASEEEGDTGALASRMRAALDARAAGKRLVEPNAAAIASMSARAASARLAALLDEVVPPGRSQ